jgi:hypothetical protein
MVASSASAKRYTALGFGTNQARPSGGLGASISAELQGKALGYAHRNHIQ